MVLLLLCILCFVAACGDPVERHIDTIIEGGDDLEQAKMELNMAKRNAVGPLVRAFGDRSLSVRARVDLAGALYRLYLREEDVTIIESLVKALEDPEPRVRAGVAGAIGNLRKAEAVAPLLHQLEVESDPGVQHEILTALEFMSLRGPMISTSLFSEGQKESLTSVLVRIRSSDSDVLRKDIVNWLEVLAEERADEARQRYLEV